jgi:hypothetical protein
MVFLLKRAWPTVARLSHKSCSAAQAQGGSATWCAHSIVIAAMAGPHGSQVFACATHSSTCRGMGVQCSNAVSVRGQGRDMSERACTA